MEDVGATCIYRNELVTNVGETSGVTQDVASDPTVGDDIPDFCTLCGQRVLCDTCGEATDGGTYLEVEDPPNTTLYEVARQGNQAAEDEFDEDDSEEQDDTEMKEYTTR